MYLHLADDKFLGKSRLQEKWDKFRNWAKTQVSPRASNLLSNMLGPRAIIGNIGKAIEFTSTGDISKLDPTAKASKEQIKKGLIGAAVIAGAVLLGTAGAIPILGGASGGKAALLPKSGGKLMLGDKLKHLIGSDSQLVKQLGGILSQKLITGADGLIKGISPGVNPDAPLDFSNLSPVGDPPPTDNKDNTLLYIGLGLLAFMAIKK